MASVQTFRAAGIAALALSAVSNAAAISKRIGFQTTCDGARNPDWSGCQTAFDAMNKQSGENANYNFPINEGDNENCIVFYGNNCAVSICDFAHKGYVPNYLVVDAVNDLQSDCEPNAAGGSANDNDGSMGVGVYSDQGTPQIAAKQKRGTSWEQAYTIDNAAPTQYRQQVLNAQPGGSSWTLSKSESQINMVMASVSLTEDLFDIFSSTQSISYSYSKTVSESSSSTINNNCADNQFGTLYWYPLFTQYHGGFTPNGPSPANIYVPIVESDGSAAGRYQVVCSD